LRPISRGDPYHSRSQEEPAIGIHARATRRPDAVVTAVKAASRAAYTKLSSWHLIEAADLPLGLGHDVG